MEQKSDFAYDRQSNALMNATGIRSNADYKTVNTLTNNSQKKLTSPNLDKHDLATILQIVTVFIPYVGPLISSGIGYLDAKNYWDEGKKQDAALVAVLSSLPAIGAVVSKIPGVKQLGKKGMTLLASKIAKYGTKFAPSKVEQEVIQGISKNEQLVKNEVNSFNKRFNLERKATKSKKPTWDYKKTKINNELELHSNPRGKENVAVVKNVSNNEYVELKTRTDADGTFYYMSAKMPSNPRNAGLAIQELKKLIPKGARFGETASGSLSTDSFYSMLRRAKDFTPKVKNYIKLNASGTKRFQPFLKNVTKSNYHPEIYEWKNMKDAKILLDELNKEIQKSGITSLAKIVKNSDGLFEIQIPNIQLIMK